MQPVRYQAPTDGPKPVLMQREQQFPSSKFNGSDGDTPHTTIKLIIIRTSFYMLFLNDAHLELRKKTWRIEDSILWYENR